VTGDLIRDDAAGQAQLEIRGNRVN